MRWYTKDGYTGDSYCKDCGEKVSAGSIITKLGHIDKNEDHKCDICEKTLSVIDNKSTEVVVPQTGDTSENIWRIFYMLLMGSVVIILGIGMISITQKNK